MAVRRFSQKNLTGEVLRRMRNCRDRRLKQVMTSFIRHLHAFVREVKPTPEEWMKGIGFLIETGRWCDAKRNEFILLSDTQGVSMLVDALNYRARAGATQSTVLGPFHRAGAPEYALGANIAKNPDDGEPCRVSGTVCDRSGRPIAGATLDVWEAGADGLYDSQKGEAMNLRGMFRTDAGGRFHFRCVKPTAYPVPHDGPAGRLLEATGRHPMRPPHLHFRISAPGFETLVTHLFVRGGPYLDSDAVFGVKPELIVDFRRGRDGIFRAHYDFVLVRQRSREARSARLRIPVRRASGSRRRKARATS